MTVGAAYLAAPGLEQPLLEELLRAGIAVDRWHGRLALTSDPPQTMAWALDCWTAPALYPIASVGAAADVLRGMQRNWASYGAGYHRRMALIEGRLPPLRPRPLVFPAAPPTSHLGAWTLLEPGLLVASPTTTSPVPRGEWLFEEDHIGPPSRAYLKLYEALTRLGVRPGPGERCIDLGASPGGWSWVLAGLGADVLAVDRAPLDPRMAVPIRLESAFGMEPEPADWLFSDVIAYPARLLALVRRWIDAGCVGRIVCSVKFQGATDHETADAFAKITGGRLVHLFQNKHELTFLWAR